MDIESMREELKLISQQKKVPLIPEETGEVLRFFASLIHAKSILEIGTGIGYSTCWLFEGTQGEIVSIEKDETRAQLAKDYFESRGIKEIRILNGDALEIINHIKPGFDLIFQDGPKGQYINMLERLIHLLNPGGILITDNVSFRGYLGKKAEGRYRTIIKRLTEYNTALKEDKRLKTIILPVGDGVAISQKWRY